MIKFEKTEVIGWEHALRGMRNPMNSWNKSDSKKCCEVDCIEDKGLMCDGMDCNNFGMDSIVKIGYNDLDLMKRLSKGGSVHAKYRRMIVVYVDITAPLYWWKEFDTYKVGTTTNSCSTMHKIHSKEFTLEDFSCEHLGTIEMRCLENTIAVMNMNRDAFNEDKNKKCWWQMIQLLPSSYNQKRTVMLNYEVLSNIYKSRQNHKLDEWVQFCEWIEQLPYYEII